MVLPMNHAQPHWSQTSARLLNTCPRAWALTYGQPRRSAFEPRQNWATRPRDLDELVLRAMRQAWMENISDMYQRKIWTKAYTSKVVSRRVHDALAEHNMDAPMLLRQQKIERAVQQLRLLGAVHALRPMTGGEPKRWAFFDRRDPVEIGDLTVYAAPDLAVFHQNRWTLIRLQFRTPTVNPLGQQLEHLLAVQWALNQPGFPDDVGAFRLKVVAWRGNRWLEHHVDVSPQSVNQALALAHQDVQEMRWLVRWAGADPTLESLPLASHSRHCNGCLHINGCPARTGLAAAKEQQEKVFIQSVQSEPTRSAKTA